MCAVRAQATARACPSKTFEAETNQVFSSFTGAVLHVWKGVRVWIPEERRCSLRAPACLVRKSLSCCLPHKAMLQGACHAKAQPQRQVAGR